MAGHNSLHRADMRRTVVIRLLIAALCLGVAYLIFEFGRISAGYDILAAARERQALKNDIVAIKTDKLALQEQVALLETHRDIDRESYKVVEQNLTKLQAKIQEQQDAIAFYRGIVSPADGKAGLRVQDLKLIRGKVEREYTIRLVLVQAMKHDRKVSGDVQVSIAGTQDGSQKSYDYRELMPTDGESKWAFSFRYFQDFNRDVVLPDGFTPEHITVHVESKTKSIDSVEQTYSWLSSQS